MGITKVKDCEECEYFGEFSCMGLLDVDGITPSITYNTKCPDKAQKVK